MQLLVITRPKQLEQEQQICAALFEHGLQTLHLRKPAASINELRKWLQQLPQEYHGRVMLHTHHRLAQEFAVKGMHFREADRGAAATTEKRGLTFSTSFHTLEGIHKPQPYFDYAFLSPVFQSISKNNYPAAFALEELKEILPQAQLPVVALGGIASEKMPLVRELGFAGAAALGAVWQTTDPVTAFKELLKQ